MERPYRLLLVAGLLAALLPAAAATSGPQPGAPCDSTLLATQAALFCAPDMPAAQCCQTAFVAAVDLGGGVPCLCRVAAEPQLVMAGLNASHLLKLYTFCGGFRDGACLAAACKGPAPPAALVSSPPPSTAARPKQHDGATHAKAVHADAAASTPYTSGCEVRPGADLAYTCKATGTGPTPLGVAVSSPPPTSSARRRKLVELKCDSFALGSSLVSACGDSHHPSLPCCEEIINTVDEDCVCDIIEVPEVAMAGIMVSRIWRFYGICGGTRPLPTDTTVCREESPPPPPPPPVRPPPPPPSQGAPASTDESILKEISKLLTTSIATSYTMVGAIVLTAVGALAWNHYSDKTKEPGRHAQRQVEMQGVEPRQLQSSPTQESSFLSRAVARVRRRT
ncbi:hypothetical protein ZWY2020_053989 [Hordeum vulgare]|nr:hypothetical protein ZWY2020_053989 [Hordeum vulgare]